MADGVPAEVRPTVWACPQATWLQAGSLYQRHATPVPGTELAQRQGAVPPRSLLVIPNCDIERTLVAFTNAVPNGKATPSCDASNHARVHRLDARRGFG